MIKVKVLSGRMILQMTNEEYVRQLIADHGWTQQIEDQAQLIVELAFYDLRREES
jgi:hypothetical protein